jgi:plastocyanin
MKLMHLLAVMASIAPAARAAVVDISIQNFQFGSANAVVSVTVGDTVRWTNNDGDAHTVTSGADRTADGKFDAGNLDPGQTFSFTFTAAGNYPYFCAYHFGMESSIEVKPATAKTVTIDVKNLKFGANNAQVAINVGDTVTWRNLDTGITHTVTSGLPADPDRGSLFDDSFRGSASSPPTISHTFNTAGTFPYHCRPHASMGMVSSILVEATTPPPVRGDLTGDGKVDGADVTAALKVVGGADPLADGVLPNVDVAPAGGDSVFDLLDAARILRFASGLDTSPL